MSLVRSIPARSIRLALALLVLCALDLSADPLGPSSRRTSWVISEIMYHPPSRSDGRELEFIEIYNAGLIAEDLGGHRLEGELTFTFPSNTVLPAGGFLVVAPVPTDVEAVHGITGVLGGLTNRLSNGGGTVRLLNPQGAILLEVEYDDDPPWPVSADGGGRSLVLNCPSYGEADSRAWAASAAPGGSPGTHEPASPDPSPAPVINTAAPGAAEVVINEIMYHPPTGDDDEFIELFNPASATVNLGGWRFTDGIEFEFPPDASLPPGGYLVVARNTARLRESHPALPAEVLFGNYQGSLSDGGERVALARPVAGPSPSDGTTYLLVDEVFYRDGGDWGHWADGGGASLELIDARSDNAAGANWTDSDESAKAEWTQIEHTGVVEQGVGRVFQVHLLSQGAGEYLVDDVEVRRADGPNLLDNGHFSSGTEGWILQGTLSDSSWAPLASGEPGAPGALHVRAVARGDTGANRIRSDLRAELPSQTVATLSARVRWLRGHPEFLIRLQGNYLEAWGSLDLPRNLGTPGARNSRAVENAPPAIRDMTHRPVLPSAGEAVVIQARIDDPDGLKSVWLQHEVDPSATTQEILMTDDGTGADEAAGDGIFSAILPGQPAGTLVSWRIVADDNAVPAASRSYPATDARVRFGEIRPSGTLGTYRIWMTQETFERWVERPKLDNHPLPVTFVYNDERVIHGVGAMYAGSPHLSPSYSTPIGNLCGYVLTFPEDEPFLGAREVVLDWPGRDTTAQQEPMAYWVASQLGIPYNHRRYIRLHINGVTETERGSIYEDAQQVNSDLVESWNPGRDRGDLHKIEQWFEFNDNVSPTHVGPPRLLDYRKSDGTRNLAAYRWSWLKRAVQESANDYRGLLALVDAANAPDPGTYTRQMLAFADMEEWMRVFATENIIVNFDAWGSDIGKNMYAYRPAGGKWQLYMWDIDWVMIPSAQHGYSPESPLMYLGPAVFGEGNRDPVVGRMYAEPAFQRAYWRAIEDAVQGPLRPERIAARMDATYAALVAQGVTRSAGGSLSGPAPVKSWLQQRRAYLLSQLATVDAPFSLTPPPASITGSNLVTLQGTAPIAAYQVLINDQPYPVTWHTVQQWSVTVPLATGANSIRVEAADSAGNKLTGMSVVASVTYNGSVTPAQEAIVLNEIQYYPASSGAAFVEFFNQSADTAFDLSGWRIDGLGLTLPPGTLIRPRDFLLVAADRQALAHDNGLQPFVAAEFEGQLSVSGESLRLLMPGAQGSEEVLVDQVRYEGLPPWPVPAEGSGVSLQLIDPRQDNRRPANWTLTGPAGASTPDAPNAVAALLPDFPVLWINEFQPNNLSGPRDAAGQAEPWVELFNAGSQTLAMKDFSLTDAPDHSARWRFPDGLTLGPGQFLVVWLDADGGATTPGELHANFRPAPENGTLALFHHVGDASFAIDSVHYSVAEPDRVIALLPDGDANRRFLLPTASPGAPNTGVTQPPRVVINEWMAANQDAVADPADGDFDDWIELFNASDLPADLSGHFLSDNSRDPFKYAVPAGTTIPARGYLLIWADEEGSQYQPGGDLHADFRLSQAGEEIVLTGPDGAVLDTVRFTAMRNDEARGRWPDGASIPTEPLGRPSPRAANVMPANTGVTPRIVGITLTPTPAVMIQVSWTARPGVTYRLQASDSVSGPWIDLTANVTVTGDLAQASDPVSTQVRSRFYRVSRIP